MKVALQELEHTELPATSVALKGNKLGQQIKDRGQSFLLSAIFGEEATKSGEDRPASVYFRTAQDDIYRLEYVDGKALLTNANLSRIINSIDPIELSPEALEQKKLTIRDAFAYGNQNKTTSIIEIVSTTNKIYSRDDLMKMTNGRSNTIIDDFEGRLPSKPIPFPK